MSAAIQVERELRDRILRQQYAPGSQLREEPLAAELGVTRTAVRSALVALEARRLVERIPNRGAVVARIAPEQLLDIYDVFELLEGLTARLAAERSAPGDWDELIGLFGQDLEEQIEAGNYDAYLEAVDQYRRVTNRIAANDFLSGVLSSIYDQTNAMIRRVLMIPGRAQESIREHRVILDALRRGDAEMAERLKRENMGESRQLLQRHSDFFR